EAVELNPSPEAAQVGTAERRVVAVAGGPYLPCVMARPAAVGESGRGDSPRQHRRRGRPRGQQDRTPQRARQPSLHASLPWSPDPARAPTSPAASPGIAGGDTQPPIYPPLPLRARLIAGQTGQCSSSVSWQSRTGKETEAGTHHSGQLEVGNPSSSPHRTSSIC